MHISIYHIVFYNIYIGLPIIGRQIIKPSKIVYVIYPMKFINFFGVGLKCYFR